LTIRDWDERTPVDPSQVGLKEYADRKYPGGVGGIVGLIVGLGVGSCNPWDSQWWSGGWHIIKCGTQHIGQNIEINRTKPGSRIPTGSCRISRVTTYSLRCRTTGTALVSPTNDIIIHSSTGCIQCGIDETD